MINMADMPEKKKVELELLTDVDMLLMSIWRILSNHTLIYMSQQQAHGRL